MSAGEPVGISTVHVVPSRDVVEHVVPGGIDEHAEPGRWLTIEALV